MPAALFLYPLPPSNASHSPHLPNPSSSNRPDATLRFPIPLKHPSFLPRVFPPHYNHIPSNTLQNKDPNFPSSLTNPFLHQNGVKMPTAPWMNSPLLLPPEEVLDLSKKSKEKSRNKSDKNRSLTQRVKGGRGKQAMRKIVESITKLQDINPTEKEFQKRIQHSEFRVPLEKLKEIHSTEEFEKRTQKSEFRVSLERVREGGEWKLDGRMPWAKAERIVFRRAKKEKVVTAAELSLSETELGRLRCDAVKMKKWVKVKKLGVTQTVVDAIKMNWRKSELAMVKFDVPLCKNMERAREIVEIKTGCLVVWSKKDTLVVYRGCDYQSRVKTSRKLLSDLSGGEKVILGKSEVDVTMLQNEIALKDRGKDSLPTGFVVEKSEGTLSANETLYEREANRLLDGLGPRFIDWWRPKPLPVDADLLPELVPDYRTPFRLCPPNVRPKLTDDELTYLRKLARPLPTHFALGRNTKLQGLAAAILKLWEKSLIVKIAVKYGIPNTNNEQMSWELKHLTGGVLILRNKFFIILYRGKDFLPPKVANLIDERETELQTQQLQEESARLKAVESLSVVHETLRSSSGTFLEFQDIQTKCEHLKDGNWEIKVQFEAEKERLEKELRKQERKLLILKLKTERSEKELMKLNSAWRPVEQAADREMITEEERQMFRKIGQKMDEILLLGRRGIYDGVIGSIHQHWKHREIVKVITMQRLFSQIIYTARLLEIESGGILVAVEKFRRGHAIIIYRGKNYRRPLKLLPENLLVKREALQRSIEMQRRGSLKFFAGQRQRIVWDLKRKIREIQRRYEELVPRESRSVDLSNIMS
ncbi:maize chloroplast splicing factor-like protein [Tasmannia lanceolata]|uniref:maize chloroplast splicing factor-like protein n=1 Tax=Tasmannia lanceolata TaxID=3420 RepID=UPI004063F51E